MILHLFLLILNNNSLRHCPNGKRVFDGISVE